MLIKYIFQFSIVIYILFFDYYSIGFSKYIQIAHVQITYLHMVRERDI